jgi:O-antigen/teichoic acid export membrane protein
MSLYAQRGVLKQFLKSRSIHESCSKAVEFPTKAHRFASPMRFSIGNKMSITLALQLFQVMRLGTAVLTGILLAKSSLTLSEIGTWELLLFMGSTFTFFWVNGLLQGLAPSHGALEEADQKSFFFNVFVLFCGISGLLFLVLVLGERFWVPILTNLKDLPYFKLYCGYLLLNLPSYPVEYIYLLQKKKWHIIAWGLASFGIYLLAFFVPLFAGLGLGISLKCLIVWSAIKLVWALRLVFESSRIEINFPACRHYLLFSFPLMLSGIVSNAMLLYDNWLVGWYYQDTSIFAIYRYGARELPLASALLIALSTSMIPRFVESQAIGMQELKAKTLRLMHLLFPLTMLLLCTSHWFFPRLFNPGFEGSAELFNIYLLALASRVLLPTPILLSKGESGVIFKVSLAELGIKLVLGFCFLHFWGLVGLAWSVVLSFWVEKIGLIYVLESKYAIRTKYWLAWNWYIFYTLGLGLVYGINLLVKF